jgi:hypothetical protein
MLTLICGPIDSGKTALARTHMGPSVLEVAPRDGDLSPRTRFAAHPLQYALSTLSGGVFGVSSVFLSGRATDSRVFWTPHRNIAPLPWKDTPFPVRRLAHLWASLGSAAVLKAPLLWDHPEIGLPPSIQIGLGEVIVQAAQEGLSLSVITHSDFVVKTLNVALALHARRAAGYTGFPDRKSLDPQKVRFFETTHEGEAMEGAITQWSLPVASMDAAIVAIQSVEEEVRYA